MSFVLPSLPLHRQRSLNCLKKALQRIPLVGDRNSVIGEESDAKAGSTCMIMYAGWIRSRLVLSLLNPVATTVLHCAISNLGQPAVALMDDEAARLGAWKESGSTRISPLCSINAASNQSPPFHPHSLATSSSVPNGGVVEPSPTVVRVSESACCTSGHDCDHTQVRVPCCCSHYRWHRSSRVPLTRCLILHLFPCMNRYTYNAEWERVGVGLDLDVRHCSIDGGLRGRREAKRRRQGRDGHNEPKHGAHQIKAKKEDKNRRGDDMNMRTKVQAHTFCAVSRHCWCLIMDLTHSAIMAATCCCALSLDMAAPSPLSSSLPTSICLILCRTSLQVEASRSKATLS